MAVSVIADALSVTAPVYVCDPVVVMLPLMVYPPVPVPSRVPTVIAASVALLLKFNVRVSVAPLKTTPVGGPARVVPASVIAEAFRLTVPS